MLEVLKLHSEDFENEAVQEGRVMARRRIISAIQAALPSQPDADPGKFGIEISPATATLLAEAARIAGMRGMEPISPSENLALAA